MRSRTSYFNATVFRKHLKTLWPLAAAYTLLLFLALFMQVNMYAGSDYFSDLAAPSLRTLLHNHLLSSLAGTWPVIFMIYGTALGMGLFAYLMNPRLSTGLHALPLRRETHYLSALAAGAAYIAGPNLLIAGLFTAVTAARGVFTPAVFTWLAVATVQGLFFLCLMALCAQATGSGIFAALLAVVMNVLFPVCEQFIRMIGSEMLYGVETTGWRLTVPLSPVLHFASSQRILEIGDNGRATAFIGWGYLGGVALAAALLIALALLLYRRRPLESAGEVIAHPFLRPVFRIAMAVGCALVLGNLVYEVCFSGGGWEFLTACIVLCAAIGYTGAEMLMGKTFRVMKKIYPRLAVICAAALCLCLATGFDVLSLARRLPDVDTVREAYLHVRGHSLAITDSQALARLQAANLKAVDEGPARGDSADYCTIRYYVGNDGDYWSRSYDVPATADALADPQSAISQIVALLNDPHLILASLGDLKELSYIEVNGNDLYNGYETFAGQDARALLAAMEADIGAGALGRYRTREEERAAGDSAFYLTLVFNAGAHRLTRYGHITVYPDCTETLAFLEAWQP